VHLLNGKYYQTSRKQFCDHLEYLKTGFTVFTIPITISEWSVGPGDGHLNKNSIDQVMQDLATQFLPYIE
jgi:hypothetical protein